MYCFLQSYMNVAGYGGFHVNKVRPMVDYGSARVLGIFKSQQGLNSILECAV